MKREETKTGSEVKVFIVGEQRRERAGNGLRGESGDKSAKERARKEQPQRPCCVLMCHWPRRIRRGGISPLNSGRIR